MHRSRSDGWRSLAPVLTGLAVLAVLGGTAPAGAQSIDSTVRDTLHSRNAPAEKLAGRVRVALSASAVRMDAGFYDAYAVNAGFAPFLGEHLQVGISPTWRALDDNVNPAFQTRGGSVAARYIFGGDPHWRGFVGVFGGAWSANSNHSSQLGAQLGTLYFLTPALAIRAGIDLRRGAPYSAGQPRSTLVYVTLDPYAFGAADDVAVAPAGFGTLDIAGSYVYERLARVSESGISGTIAPYLTRWAQIGASGEADGTSQEIRAHQLRGFGRIYLPLTVRTQPFAEGFAETSTFNGEDGGLTSYGGEIGMRRMLNANVALDVGVQRTMHPREMLGSGNFTHPYREPGGTALVVAMMTRIGRAR